MTQPPPMHSLLDANGRPALGVFEQVMENAVNLKK